MGRSVDPVPHGHLVSEDVSFFLGCHSRSWLTGVAYSILANLPANMRKQKSIFFKEIITAVRHCLAYYLL